MKYLIYMEKKNLKLIKLILTRYIKITCLLIIGFILFSYFIGPYIYNYWIGNKYELKMIFLLLIVFGLVTICYKASINNTFCCNK